MKITIFTTALLLLAPSLAHPQPSTNLQIVPEVAQRDEGASHLEELWKRKGGGGKGGKGGSSSSGSSSGYILTPSSCHIPTASANTIHQQFNRQRQYLFQHRRCDQTGLRCTALVRRRQILRWRRDEPLYIWSPVPLGITPLFLGVGALSVFPGLWLYGAYSYPYNHPYTFRNRSATNTTNANTTTTKREESIDIRSYLTALLAGRDDTDTGANQTKPVDCLCAAYAECGCDDNGNTTFLDSLIGDGSYSSLNLSLVNVVDVNGTSTIVLNGTLENGTTTSGGTEDADGAAVRAKSSGYVALVAVVGFMVYFI